MPLIERRVVEDVEHVVVTVKHQFTLDEAVLAVMAAKSSVRPGQGRRVVPLTVAEVRAALHYEARHAHAHEVIAQLRTEPHDGPAHRLASWARSELLRLRIFVSESSVNH
jgi:hypothetical protein